MDLSGNHGQQLPEHTAAMHAGAAASRNLGFEMVNRGQVPASAAAGGSRTIQVRLAVRVLPAYLRDIGSV